MKAPLSKRIRKILSDKNSANQFVREVIVKHPSDGEVVNLGGQKYILRRVHPFVKK